MKKLWVLLLPLLLAGCGLPPAFQIASWALDGISLIVSGKSVSDHAISVAVQRDCAMWRIVRGDDICSEFAPAEVDGVMLAERQDIGEDSGEPSQQDLDEIGAQLSEIAPAAGGERQSVSAGSLVLASTMQFGTPISFSDGYVDSEALPERQHTSPTLASTQPFGRPTPSYYAPSDKPVLGAVPDDEIPVPATTNTSSLVPAALAIRQLAALNVADDAAPMGDLAVSRAAAAGSAAVPVRSREFLGGSARYLVLGSFRVRENAERLSAGLSGFDTFISSTRVRGELYYRVLARPSSGENLEALKRRYAETTGGESWVITL